MIEKPSDDPFTGPEWNTFVRDVKKGLIPKIRDSAYVASFVPERADGTDVKFAIELGFSIMMDKPIIAIVTPGAKLPKKLAEIAEVIVEGDINDPEGTSLRLQDAIMKLDAKFK